MKLLKKLYEISSPSNQEQEMQSFITSLLKGAGIPYTQDKKGNIYATKGESDTYPCVVCHIDEVHRFKGVGYKVAETDGVLYGFNSKSMSFEGIGADDKNGIWVCFKALSKFDIIKCAFFVAEETGCNGSRNADMTFFDDCRFVLQCDRKGSSDFITDASCVELCSDEFIKDADISKFGYKEASGMMTDVMQLKENGLNVSACNISCGYYNPHTNTEMTRISDLMNCLNLVFHIINTCTKVYDHKYKKPKYKSSYYGGSCGRYYDDWSGYDYYGYKTPKKDPIVDRLRELYPSAWKNGKKYYVYDSEKGTREATKQDLYWAEHIGEYEALYDYYDEVQFDKKGNPIVRRIGEKKFKSPDKDILDKIEDSKLDEYYDQYMQARNEMEDFALNDPDNFSLESFLSEHKNDYPMLSQDDYTMICEEVAGCLC